MLNRLFNFPWIYLFNRNPEGPPSLDVLFSKWFSSDGQKGGASFNLSLAFFALVALFAISGFFIVKPAERAVVLRFGRYVETLGPGPHWLPPIVQSKRIVDVQKIFNFSHSAEMLTKDENIVFVSVAVWYRISDPYRFLYAVNQPLGSIQQATASALRHVVGHTTLMIS